MWCGGEMQQQQPVKGRKSWAQTHLSVSLAVGVLLLLLTYIVFSQQNLAIISSPSGIVTHPSIPHRLFERKLSNPPHPAMILAVDHCSWFDPTAVTTGDALRETGDGCSTEGPYSDTCELDGDVRVNGTALSVAVVPPTGPPPPRHRVWRIMSYARRNVSDAKAVTVTRLADRAAAPPCAATHAAPAVLFALGGYTGNYWHDFTDVLVPLFVASRRYDGEVWFLVTRCNPWWLAKYGTLLRRLSRHAAVDLDADTDAPVRCFPHVTVGLEMHREFTIVPDLVPRGGRRRLTMADFTAFLREAYALPRGAPARGRPRLLLVHRGHYRRIVNEADVARAAEAAGFEAVVLEPRGEARVDGQARLVNSFDVLLGLHGAGLTNAVFLPAGAVLIQVVPYGKLEPMARREFGAPAADMGLKYIDYSVAAEESTLREMLGPDHPALRDPDSVHRSGWNKVAEFYLGKQDVRINVTRFGPTLAKAFHYLRRRK